MGTQSVKVLVYSLRTHGVVGRGQRAYGLECTRPGMAEQAPSVWEEGLQAALRDALQGHDAGEVRAVAVSGQQHGLVAMDADGAVSGLTPASRHGMNRVKARSTPPPGGGCLSHCLTFTFGQEGRVVCVSLVRCVSACRLLLKLSRERGARSNLGRRRCFARPSSGVTWSLRRKRRGCRRRSAGASSLASPLLSSCASRPPAEHVECGGVLWWCSHHPSTMGGVPITHPQRPVF